MLIASLLPLLARYSLRLDLVAGPDDTVTLTVIPRTVEGAARTADAGETRPISITATAAEIDAELARGTDGALGQLIAARKDLADQIAEQRQAADKAKQAVTDAAKAKTAAPAVRTSTLESVATPAAPTSPPATAKPDEPASLF
ncbi:PRTRC system protein E [Sphingomonas sp. 2R-10]|uniref:PRTRC system protein E n=1 Tax=Sphingomonas sp. 2R-10 TaxID=3045148 RepID=UPI000F7984F4|nr:PRTRC system protein E [Sphingomonas sp. 2R-10]MDJ0276308.1 PRTRC system protein E [Sphingomonas sp. 2R-10]